ncbi:MAG: hypothetical protein WBA45_12750 [Microthrixaceae bacterium]
MTLVVASPHSPFEGGQGMRELCSGVDALYFSGRAELSTALFETLEACRKTAEENDRPVPLHLDGVEFFVHPRAFGKYRYRISHERGLIGVTPSENLPAIRVQPRAEFLHGVGPIAALEFFGSIGEFLAGGPVTWTLSRLDLFTDVQGWDLHGDERHRFVCRAERRDLHEHGAEFGGFEFGRRTTKTVCARIYDKTRQIQDEGLAYWPVIWGEAFDKSRPVLRVEAEIGRQGLVEFGINSPTDGLERAGEVWANVTEKWLTYRTPTDDETKSRWPISPEWISIQKAGLRGSALGLDRVRALKRKGQLWKITPQIVGYLTSAAALVGTDDLTSTLAAVRHLVHEDENRRGIPFTDRIADRVAEEARR